MGLMNYKFQFKEIFLGERSMQKFLMLLGYLILFFIVVLNYINFDISDAMIIILGIISAIFISLGIFLKDKEK